jgi:two-component system, NarL family, nitrate/nitrite response regulator NarL
MPENNAAVNGPSSGGAATKPKIRIVVADDHPIFRDGLCRLLALEEDFEVVAQASDGRQVLEILQQVEPDILLLDLKMPGLDGLATLQRLQAARNKTRVIVLTASDDKNEFVQAMKLGTSGIVLKQTATELLIKSIRKVHAGEIWLDSHTTAAVIRQFVANEEAPPPPPPPPVQQQQSSGGRERERSPLSQREREIVALVAQGFKNKEMAEKMFISEQTVKNHLHNIFDKLGVSDRLELALYAIHNNLHTGR